MKFLEMMLIQSVQKLTEFLNNLDNLSNIKFTYEVEQGGKLHFLDLLLKRTKWWPKASDCKNHEKVQRKSGDETIQNFEK